MDNFLNKYVFVKGNSDKIDFVEKVDERNDCEVFLTCNGWTNVSELTEVTEYQIDQEIAELKWKINWLSKNK